VAAVTTTQDTPAVLPERVLLPLGLGTALSLMGDATLYTVLPTHAAEAGIGLGAVGIMLGVNRAVRLFLNGPMGLAYDRLPRRYLLVPAFFVGVLSTAIYALTRGFWPLLGARLLWGLAWAGIWVGGNTVILDVTGDDDRGRWTGLYQLWFFLGGSLGFFLGGVLTDLVGFHRTLEIGAALTTVGALAVFLFLPETRETARRTAETADPPELTSVAPLTRHSKELWAAVLIQGVNRFAISGVMAATLALLLQARLGDQVRFNGLLLGIATLTGMLLASRTLLSMVAAPITGWLSDQLHSRWRVILVGLFAGVVGMALFAWGMPIAIVGGALLSAIAGGSLQALATTLVGDLSLVARRGRALGVLYTMGDLGSALGPPIAYALIPLISLRGAYLGCAGLFAITLLLSWRWESAS